MSKPYAFDTLQAHAGLQTDARTHAHAVPIYQTNAYVFDDTADAAAQFELKKDGYIYSRMGNPTTAVLEERMAALEGGAGAVAFASGTAAILAAVQNMASAGDEIVALSTLYGGTYTLFFSRFEKQYGIRARQVAPDDMAGLAAAIGDKTKCVYIETLSNPNINIPDIEEIARIAHARKVPVIADNTFATPYLLDCKRFGVDFVVHSLTKYVGGHGAAMGGLVSDLGTFDFKDNPRFPDFNAPDPSYHGAVYADMGRMGYLTKLRAGFLRDTGACLPAFSAFLLLMGLETLSLRMDRHCANALAIARYLAKHPAVSWVHYPALEGDAYHARAQKYFPRGTGGIFTFGIKGGAEAGRRFINALGLFALVANVSDVRSLVVHPASTTHSQLNNEQLLAAGVSADMVRLSVGLEDVNDLIADLSQALSASQTA